MLYHGESGFESPYTTRRGIYSIGILSVTFSEEGHYAVRSGNAMEGLTNYAVLGGHLQMATREEGRLRVARQDSLSKPTAKILRFPSSPLPFLSL
jgi:hypothetical protein